MSDSPPTTERLLTGLALAPLQELIPLATSVTAALADLAEADRFDLEIAGQIDTRRAKNDAERVLIVAAEMEATRSLHQSEIAPRLEERAVASIEEFRDQAFGQLINALPLLRDSAVFWDDDLKSCAKFIKAIATSPWTKASEMLVTWYLTPSRVEVPELPKTADEKVLVAQIQSITAAAACFVPLLVERIPRASGAGLRTWIEASSNLLFQLEATDLDRIVQHLLEHSEGLYGLTIGTCGPIPSEAFGLHDPESVRRATVGVPEKTLFKGLPPVDAFPGAGIQMARPAVPGGVAKGGGGVAGSRSAATPPSGRTEQQRRGEREI